MNEPTQFYLMDTFEIGDGEMTDIACEECAVKFAKEHELEWSGGKVMDSYTLPKEGSDAYVSCLADYALGESDYPHSCCTFYLKTDFTDEGIQYLKDEFPQWVQDLYLKDA